MFPTGGSQRQEKLPDATTATALTWSLKHAFELIRADSKNLRPSFSKVTTLNVHSEMSVQHESSLYYMGMGG
jgi:hypothetical protein